MLQLGRHGPVGRRHQPEIVTQFYPLGLGLSAHLSHPGRRCRFDRLMGLLLGLPALYLLPSNLPLSNLPLSNLPLSNLPLSNFPLSDLWLTHSGAFWLGL
ncbi:hypothetical protein [Shewanella salipaludis]|uniref:Uncharacterized protein n=1 Tax=Shewanella salipaludis TaxID=2723052 RepID=A0A972G3M7_9GAMM|nr:hypothetical protein [Shewanella salipaludis]NMH66886.1 hypothetical protein [Shewanella salipaludis]